MANDNQTLGRFQLVMILCVCVCVTITLHVSQVVSFLPCMC